MTSEERRLARLAKQRLRDGTAKVVCRAAGLDDNDVAERVGVSKLTAWRWLEGYNLPRGDRATRLGLLLEELLPVALRNLDQEIEAVAEMRERADAYEAAIGLLRGSTHTRQAA